jgi:hypothetical protein
MLPARGGPAKLKRRTPETRALIDSVRSIVAEIVSDHFRRISKISIENIGLSGKTLEIRDILARHSGLPQRSTYSEISLESLPLSPWLPLHSLHAWRSSS